MKRTVLFFLFTAAALLPSSCVFIDGEGIPSESFDYKLRGTWKTNPGTYETTVQIDFDNKITITGISQSGRPLSGLTRGYRLKGYSEQSKNKLDDMAGNLKIENTDDKWYTISYTYKYDYLSNPTTVLTLIGTTAANNLVLFKQ